MSDPPADFDALLDHARREQVCAECREPRFYRRGGRGSLFCSDKCRYRFRDRRRYAEDPEGQRAKSRAYYAANREKKLAAVKAYQAAKRAASSEPLAPPPLVLADQDSPQLGKRGRRRIIERPEDPLAVVDRQREDLRLEPERLVEDGSCRFVDEAGELANVVVGDRDAGEEQEGEGSR